MKILTKEQILLLHSQLIENFGGSSDIRDEALLDSAINTPFQTYDGEELYPTLLDKASRLCFGLVKNHPFVDGNKRIGTHAMLVFLAINGIDLEYSDIELIELILSVRQELSPTLIFFDGFSSILFKNILQGVLFLHIHPFTLNSGNRHPHPHTLQNRPLLLCVRRAGSPSRIFCTEFTDAAIPRFPFTLYA